MIPRLLFYLLLALLPVQIGRHFFFNFSLIKGLYSDYSLPVLYLTDIIIFLIIITRIKFSAIRHPLKNVNFKKHPWTIFLFFVICYLLFNVIFIALNKYAALYKLLKICEFILLGISITKIKPRFSAVVFFLSVGAAYTSLLAIWQFMIQKSVGSLWWYLGERTFSVSTPGIAAFNWQGNLVLRSYATFAHPNVLAGFLVIVICLILSGLITRKLKLNYFMKYWFNSVCFLSIVALFLTFSRLSWLFLLAGILVTFLFHRYLGKNIKIKESLFLFLLYIYIFLSVIIYQLFPSGGTSLQERADLVKETIALISSNPVAGVGLNNSIIRVVSQLPGGFGLYFFQPVHNIYLLVTSEAGIVGLILFLVFMSAAIFRSLRLSSPYLPVVLLLLFLGGFDHYLLTLQQGMLIFVLFTSLAFLPKNDVN